MTVHIEIDGKKVEVPQGKMIIEVADELGIAIPRFCYHKKLSIAANCRMCLVEVEKAPKPLPACATPVMEGMKVFTKSQKAQDAQKAVMEFLLINHPLDCPICDQGGQCELQDVSLQYGKGYSRYDERKRVVKDKDIGPLISTEMTRCIHCTRCVRFGSEVAGQRELGVTGRGENAEIGTYVAHTVSSEMSGNVIDLCPVGALTSKPFRFLARAWELKAKPSISAHEPIGANILYHSYQDKVIRALPRDNEALNEVWLSDRDRFGYEGFNHTDRLTQPMIKTGEIWETTDWNTALQVATKKLGDVFVREPKQVGALVSPNATLEEMFMLQKLMRDMGSNNIDHRLRQSDTTHQSAMGLYPQLGVTLEALEQKEVIILIGSHIRKEQPLLAHRIRKATQHGGQVYDFNPQSFDYNFEVARTFTGDKGDFLTPVMALVKALMALKSGQLDLPQVMQQALADVTVTDDIQQLASACHQKQISILLGDYALSHPLASQFYAWGCALAKLLEATFGEITYGPNSAGAWISGAIPHRTAFGQTLAETGLSAKAMLEQGMKAFLLLNCEPAFDCANPALAQKALNDATAVVALSVFDSPELRATADVILPITPMSEMAGTYVNALGDWQSFTPAVHPLGDCKPAWKVLRVMGNLWELPGYTQETPEAIKDDLAKQYAEITPQTGAWPIPTLATQQAAQSGLVRLAPQSLYSVDSVVRRAKSLQATPDANVAHVRLSLEQAKALNFEAGTNVWVTEAGQQSREPLPIVIDDSVPMGAAVVASSIPQVVPLGAPFGNITLHAAEKGQ